MGEDIILKVNPKAANIMINGFPYQGGAEVKVGYNDLRTLNVSLLSGNYKKTGRPLLEIITAPPSLDREKRKWSDGPLDFAYPLKHDVSDNYAEIRYSLRSIPNVAGAGRVYIAGGKPSWINDRVTHLPVLQERMKFGHVSKCLEAVLNSDISDPFVWMNDDMVFLNPIDEIPPYARLRTIQAFCSKLHLREGKDARSREHNEFVKAMWSQRDIITSWGYDPSVEMCGDTHHPLLVDKSRLQEIVAKVRRDFPDHPIGAWKMIYNAGRPLIPVKDPKLMMESTPLPDGPFVSFDDPSWAGLAGAEVRLIFRRRGVFEL